MLVGLIIIPMGDRPGMHSLWTLMWAPGCDVMSGFPSKSWRGYGMKTQSASNDDSPTTTATAHPPVLRLEHTWSPERKHMDSADGGGMLCCPHLYFVALALRP